MTSGCRLSPDSPQTRIRMSGAFMHGELMIGGIGIPHNTTLPLVSFPPIRSVLESCVHDSSTELMFTRHHVQRNVH